MPVAAGRAALDPRFRGDDGMSAHPPHRAIAQVVAAAMPSSITKA
jgi:hypothetical protein